LWILRLGIGGFFLAGSAMALVSFSLFGCPCFEGRTARKEPDPGVAAPPLVKPEPAKPIPEDPVK
jgi:hypothetical protein